MIQKKYWQKGSWFECSDWDIDLDYVRIRPQDKHLRYGPISRVLFEAAKEPPEYLESIKEWYARDYALEFRGSDLYNMGMDEGQRSFFLLLVAEALAHEGL
jgi:hypothetical protein